MKETQGLFLILITCMTLVTSAFAQKPTNKVNSKTLHVDGEFEKSDEELNFLKGELNNVRGLRRGYKKKSKVYQKLTDESQELKDNFENYMDNRVDYEGAIAGYNKLINCMKNGDAKKCRPKSKREKRREAQTRRGQQQQQRQQPVYDSVGTTMAATSRGPGKYDFIREIDARISSRDAELLSCYRRGGYKQQGVLNVQLKISPNGQLHHLGYENTTQINDQRVVSCLSQVLYSISYPRTPTGKLTTVRKPFVFHLM